MCQCTPGIKTPWCGKPGCERPPQRVPEREEVYEAGLEVHRLMQELAAAQQKYDRLVRAHYGQREMRKD